MAILPPNLTLSLPDDLSLMTPYVIAERGDWFEDEIRFFRLLLQSTDNVLDVGANYGVYTLTAAHHAPKGQVWAMEPDPATAAHLKQSLTANTFTHAHLLTAAASNRAGSGTLTKANNSELNHLLPEGEDHSQTGGQPITLTTLDAAAKQHKWPAFDVVKIDAEGHESQVIEGASELLRQTSPLVMMEAKAGQGLDISPFKLLEAMGYRCYRLVPALNVLAPVNLESTHDRFLLNLFAAKPDRAAKLAARNLLADEYPLGANLGYPQALAAYHLAIQPGPAAARLAALHQSYNSLSQLAQGQASHPVIISFAAAAAGWGARDEAVQALDFALRADPTSNPPDAKGQPFLVLPHPWVNQPSSPAHLRASLLFAFEHLRAFSSYFSPRTTVDFVSQIHQLGFTDSALTRRLELATRRLATHSTQKPTRPTN